MPSLTCKEPLPEKEKKTHMLSGRLPLQPFLPDHYTIWWDASGLLAAPDHRGRVRIHGTVTAQQPCRVITLHASFETLAIVRAHCETRVLIPRPGVAQDVIDLCVQEGDADLPPGPAIVNVWFNWRVSQAPCGIYAGRRAGSTTTPYFVTQFEPTAARRAFPCVDEPDAKARFVVYVRPPDPSWLVLANMPRALPFLNKKGYIRFQATPRMSTYLVAMLLAPPGTFTCATTKFTSSGTVVRVWRDAVEDKDDSTTVAADAAVRALTALEHLTGFTFCLPKLDLVPVHDFDSGAMENWGLLVFRRVALLTPPGAVTLVQDTVVHEVAHQWFGNMVTMRWWHHLWLNEAFATLCATWVRAYWSLDLPGFSDQAWALALDSTLPPWKRFLCRDLPPVLDTRPVRTPRARVALDVEIEGQFDGSTYTKGASILRGLFLALGASGPGVVRCYLANAMASKGIANPSMLWAAARSCAPGAVAKASAALDWGPLTHTLSSNPEFGWPALVLWQGPEAYDLAMASRRFGTAVCQVLAAIQQVTTHSDTRAYHFLQRLVPITKKTETDLHALLLHQFAQWKALCKTSPAALTDEKRRVLVHLIAAKPHKGKFALRHVLGAVVQTLAPACPDVDMDAWTALLVPMSGVLLAQHEVEAVLAKLRTCKYAGAHSLACSMDARHK